MRPRYADLPELPGTDLRHAWDVFGPADALGTLNFLTPERRREAAALVRHGLAVNLALPLSEPEPSPFGRRALVHEVYPTTSFSWDDRLVNLDMQASTQWDGFLHVRHREFGFYGGRLTDPEPGDKLGVDRWVEHGVVGRGVLLDVETHLREQGRAYDPLTPVAIGAEDLAATAAAQGVELRQGDILCLRFGWTKAYRALDRTGREQLAAQDWPPFVGLEAGENTARQLWDWGIAALACDNPAVEAAPGDPRLGSLHRQVLAGLGLVLGELFDFDALADDCAADARYSFLFSAVPLHVPDGVGSPANAVAIR